MTIHAPWRLPLPFLLVLAAANAWSQETTGTLEGRVLDVQGQSVGEASVTVTGPALQGSRAAVTNAGGVFVLLALPVGAYSVKLTHATHGEQTLEGVRVRLGQTTSLGDVRLRDQAHWQEEVVVTGRAPLVDPASTFVGADLLAQEYAALPIERDYRSVATLLPQANQSFLGDAAFDSSRGLGC